MLQADAESAMAAESEESINNRNLAGIIRTSLRERMKFLRVAMEIITHSVVIVYTTFAYSYNERQRKPWDWCGGFGFFAVILGIFYAVVIYKKLIHPLLKYLRKRKKEADSEVKIKIRDRKFKKSSKIIFYGLPPIAFAAFLAYDTTGDRNRLRSLAGIVIFPLLGFIFSKYPAKIRWDTVYRGFFAQIALAMVTIRWQVGRDVLSCLGERVEVFLSYTNVGSTFVYGDEIVNKQASLAFKILTILVFVNFIVEILFYYGVLQKIFSSFGWALQSFLGTTVIESVFCCTSAILGNTEAFLLVKPYLADLTKSELQAVMMGSLSTVAGSCFAAYVFFGANSGYIVTASIMSAPAALAYSKLLYPEIEPSKTSAEAIDDIQIEKDGHASALSAGSEGATTAMDIIQKIVGVLIAFISFVAFMNGVLAWLGQLVGVENVTLDTILAKPFVAISFVLGVDSQDYDTVAKLISTKCVINEFVAYQQLGEYKKARLLTPRSEAIATYSLCSFSNPATTGIVLAIITSLCPSQRDTAVKLAFRAYIGGVVTCFINASIAGLLIQL